MTIGYNKHYVSQGGFKDGSADPTPITYIAVNDFDKAIYDLDQNKVDGTGTAGNADMVDNLHAADLLFIENAPKPGFSYRWHSGKAAPAGWHLCDGTSHTTATYPLLFAAIGYAYGGAGANFSLPNWTDYIIRLD